MIRHWNVGLTVPETTPAMATLTRLIRRKRRSTFGALGRCSIGRFTTIRAPQHVILAPTKKDQHRPDHCSDRVPKQQQKPNDLHRQPFARVHASFALRGDALQLPRQDHRSAAIGTFRIRPRVRAQIGKVFAAMPASACENIAAQAAARHNSNLSSIQEPRVSSLLLITRWQSI